MDDKPIPFTHFAYYHNKPNSILGMNIAGPEIKYLTFEDSQIRKRAF